jgi:HK97 family phage prohead protease
VNSQIECRAAQVADVSYPKRTATVIVAPYETPTSIYERGRSFTEIVSRGAYSGCQRRVGSIRANRDHDWAKLVGKIEQLHPERDEGLVAEIRMFKTPAGDETLELCAEDGLSASAGFALMREGGATGPVKHGAETWSRDRTVRRLNELWLDHVAFVPNPAYEAATVVDVRHTTGTTGAPNLERLEVERWRSMLAAIDSRYIK